MQSDIGLGSPRKLELGRIVISAEGGAFDTPQGARPPPVYLGASGPSGGRPLVEVEQQLVEVVLLDAKGEDQRQADPVPLGQGRVTYQG